MRRRPALNAGTYGNSKRTRRSPPCRCCCSSPWPPRSAWRVAIVLAGVAMLLAAPAYADEGSLLLERRAGMAEAERLFG